MSPAAARNSSYKLQGLVTSLLYRYRLSSPAAISGPSHDPRQLANYQSEFLSAKFRYVNCNMISQGRLRSFSNSPDDKANHGKSDFHIVKDKDKKIQPTMPVSYKQSFFSWAKWVLGSFLALLLPFWKQKWESLQGLEGNVEKVVEEIEIAAQVVENVAEVVEKVSEGVAEKLPDNHKIKEAVLVVEHLSSVTAQEAKLTQDFIHKVGDMKQDLQEMETLAEPTVDKDVEPNQAKTA